MPNECKVKNSVATLQIIPKWNQVKPQKGDIL